MKMKNLAVFAITSSLAFAQSPVEAEPKLSKEAIAALELLGSTKEKFYEARKKRLQDKLAFQSLDKEKQKEWIQFVEKSYKLSKEKRVAESLYAILEARRIFDRDIVIYNLMGSNFVELRDFKNAVKTFHKGTELQPFNASIYFNLAESYFVDEKYKEALPIFLHTEKLNNINGSIKHFSKITTFKIELCHLGLSKDNSLSDKERKEHLKKFNTAVDARSYKNHHLLTYYSKAAQAFSKDDEQKAKEWIEDARYVFNNQQDHMPWLDTMLEFGYINKLYRTADNDTVSDDIEKKKPALFPNPATPK